MSKGISKAEFYLAMGVPSQFIPYLTEMEHIQLEQWDMAKDFAAIDNWINALGAREQQKDARS